MIRKNPMKLRFGLVNASTIFSQWGHKYLVSVFICFSFLAINRDGQLASHSAINPNSTHPLFFPPEAISYETICHAEYNEASGFVLKRDSKAGK
jgi:hypothetical protein